MTDTADNAVAIVGVGADPPRRPRRRDASGTTSRDGRYAISEVDPARWDPALYYDADPKAPEQDLLEDRRLGARLGVGPARAGSCRSRRRWATRWTTRRSGRSPARATALADAGWPERPLDLERTAVILGNAMAGEQHYQTALRHHVPRARARARARPELRRAARPTCGPRSSGELHGNLDGLAPRDHRGHDARRAGQLHGRAGRQPVQPARPELRGRRRLRLGDGGDGRGRRGPRRPRVRRGRHRRRRPQHGRVDLREVLRDRRAVGAPARARTPTEPTAS